MFCECNCTRFSSSKVRNDHTIDSVHTIGNITLVEREIQCDSFQCRELGAIAQFYAGSAIREVALVHADGDIMGFRIG